MINVISFCCVINRNTKRPSSFGKIACSFQNRGVAHKSVLLYDNQQVVSNPINNEITDTLLNKPCATN